MPLRQMQTAEGPASLKVTDCAPLPGTTHSCAPSLTSQTARRPHPLIPLTFRFGFPIECYRANERTRASGGWLATVPRTFRRCHSPLAMRWKRRCAFIEMFYSTGGTTVLCPWVCTFGDLYDTF